MESTYPLRIQAMRAENKSPRLFVTIPLALAAAIGLEPGDEAQWELLDRQELHLVILKKAPLFAKTKARK